tara:strand:+ start:4521 stop:5210 length:690 start_codon:yes stop_codon:yes gene_type:complete
MKISISQPAYIPWLGYLERINNSDLHVVLDHVPDGKKSMLNRNKIRTSSGWTWLTVPIISKNRYGSLKINELKIDNSFNWSLKHWKSIKGSYSNTQFFKHYQDFFEDIYSSNHENIAQLNQKITDYLLKNFKINTPIIHSSSLGLKSSKSELILDICKHTKASEYISGPFGRDYLNLESFKNASIRVEFHNFKHPHYSQNYDGFEKNLSAIDLLFNYGENSGDILKNNI